MTRMTTTALALILAAGTAMADSHDEGAMDTTATNAEATTEDMAAADNMESNPMEDAQYIRTRDVTGGDIYTLADTEMDWTQPASYEDLEDNLNDIGEIEDVVLDSDGQLIGVIAEVGGFLDIGDKHVMLRMDDVKLMPVDDQSYAIVTRASLDDLKSMEDVDESVFN